MALLSHLKILDLSTLLPGPYATMMLADMGAEVLRVESVKHVDFLRTTPPLDGTLGANHMYLNRSKKLIALDLKQEAGVDILKNLIQKGGYDIIIEQFRPGVMKRLGLDYDTLRDLVPAVIYCSITGYGQTGPYKDRAGHDNNYLAISGVADYSRRKEQAPVPQGIQIADIAGGSMHAIAGILAAISHREQTGNGQYIDVSMTDAAFALNALAAPGLLACEEEPQAETTLLNGGSFYDYYETSDGRYFSVGSLEPPFFKALCEAIERPDVIPMGAIAFSADSPDKAEAQKNLKGILRDSFASKTFEQWLKIFEQTDACVEPVLSLKEASKHPQLKERSMVVEVPKPEGSQAQVAHPIKYSEHIPNYSHAGGEIGKDSRETLLELGYSHAEIDALSAAHVIKEAAS